MSGRKSNLLQFNVMSSITMSGNTTFTSSVTNIQFLDNIGLQYNFVGSPVGAFNVQISSDYNQDSFGNVIAPGNWVTMTLTPSPVASGVANNIYIDINQISAPWIRSQYVNSSGVGTLNGWVTGKMV